jgi:hypothetical protein
MNNPSYSGIYTPRLRGAGRAPRSVVGRAQGIISSTRITILAFLTLGCVGPIPVPVAKGAGPKGDTIDCS